ncbi:thiol-disulfide oxidoreductase ResA [Paenibacillus agricola]|uniref:Thiol-disulfide oxidoreductase ResA n=1 Tax=Paenibacillus agricola TaxID=2716264 RepID=A0ABX0JB70_9BACL|nr:thiol-disulfide oxidoreductase ResA [Paenibacillus agricola]NHN33188.1 thiol-disulfide oxidoreductase ResA [Paenibacillus agricola]
MNRNRLLQILILVAALIVGIYAITTTFSKEEQPVKVGSMAQEFKLLGLDGQIHNLSDYHGKVLVINFWGTFCPPCVREMPALQKQYDLWKDRSVEIVGINLNESKISVESFVKQLNIGFPILLDNDTVRKKYKVMSYPTTFFIDPQGIIQDIFVGEMTENNIKTRIEKIVRTSQK